MSEQQPWHATYPEPASTAIFLPQATVLGWMESSEKIAGRDFVLVDLRRSDHEVGLILLFVLKIVLVSYSTINGCCTGLLAYSIGSISFLHSGVY